MPTCGQEAPGDGGPDGQAGEPPPLLPPLLDPPLELPESPPPEPASLLPLLVAAPPPSDQREDPCRDEV